MENLNRLCCLFYGKRRWSDGPGWLGYVLKFESMFYLLTPYGIRRGSCLKRQMPLGCPWNNPSLHPSILPSPFWSVLPSSICLVWQIILPKPISCYRLPLKLADLRYPFETLTASTAPNNPWKHIETIINIINNTIRKYDMRKTETGISCRPQTQQYFYQAMTTQALITQLPTISTLIRTFLPILISPLNQEKLLECINFCDIGLEGRELAEQKLLHSEYDYIIRTLKRDTKFSCTTKGVHNNEQSRSFQRI